MVQTVQEKSKKRTFPDTLRKKYKLTPLYCLLQKKYPETQPDQWKQGLEL